MSSLVKVLIIVVLLLPMVGEAADGFAAMGVGTRTCAEFAKDYQQTPTASEQFYFTWAQGFMSAHNSLVAGKQMANLNPPVYDLGTQMAHIRRFCDQRPLASYMEAVMELIDVLRTRQGLVDWRTLR
jgi:hypothetical protein